MSQVVGNTALAYHRAWHHADARGRVLGKLAQRIAIVLMGKHKPIFDRGADCGDYVTITNAKEIVTTGQKAEQKVYYSHTMYPGGLKTVPFKRLIERRPEEIIRKAVSGMLPKNKLRERRLQRLYIFDGEHNPYASNVMKRWEDGQTPGPSPPPTLPVGIRETLYRRVRRS